MATKKYLCQCPHCKKQFNFTPPTKKRKSNEETIVFKLCKKWFQEEYSTDFAFDGAQAGGLQMLLNKIKAAMIKRNKVVFNDDEHVKAFKVFFQCMPEDFKGKDFLFWNSRYNIIIDRMRKGITPQVNGYHNKTSSQRAELFGRFGSGG